MKTCSSNKKLYLTESLAEEALLEIWRRTEFEKGRGPLGVYLCDDCGHYHLTSRGPVNPRLEKALADGSFKISREADRWESKFKRR